MKENIDGSVGSLSSDLNQVQKELGYFFSTIKEDKPTGGTPQKKQRAFPTSFPVIRSPNLIISEHKKRTSTKSSSLLQPLELENKENIVVQQH